MLIPPHWKAFRLIWLLENMTIHPVIKNYLLLLHQHFVCVFSTFVEGLSGVVKDGPHTKIFVGYIGFCSKL